MQWRLRLAEYNFKVMSKNGPHNVQADPLSQLQTLAERTTDDLDDIPTFFLSKQFPEQTETSHIANIAMPLKLCYNHIRKHIQPKCDDDATCDVTFLEDFASDELFATLPVPTSIDLMFDLI